MPYYYNKTRGPLPLSLPSGTTVVVAKGYIDIPLSDEGCASVVRYVKKGLLIPPIIRQTLKKSNTSKLKVVTSAEKNVVLPAPSVTVVEKETTTDSVTFVEVFSDETENNEKPVKSGTKAKKSPRKKRARS